MRLLLLLLFMVPAYAQNDQNGDLNTNTQDSTVNSNNVTNSNTTQNIGAGSGSPSPVNTALAPSLMSSGQVSRLKSMGGSTQLPGLGLTFGRYQQDEECNRRLDSKQLKDMGMSVAAVARLCQSKDNWLAMLYAATPCPILVNGRMVFGKSAMLAIKQSPYLYLPDYSKKNVRKKYNLILGIGVKANEEDNSDTRSISERFRTSD